MNDLAALLPFVLIIAVFWFLVARPARRQQQKMAATQASVTVGSEVMLGSGIFGRVTTLDEETLGLEIAPGTTIRVARQAVVKVVEDERTIDPGPAQQRDENPNDPQV